MACKYGLLLRGCGGQTLSSSSSSSLITIVAGMVVPDDHNLRKVLFSRETLAENAGNEHGRTNLELFKTSGWFFHRVFRRLIVSLSTRFCLSIGDLKSNRLEGLTING
jgi:hypothetical protein